MSTTTATTKFAAPSAAAAQAAREHNEKLPLFRLPGGTFLSLPYPY
jgi:hypothetical protein